MAGVHLLFVQPTHGDTNSREWLQRLRERQASEICTNRIGRHIRRDRKLVTVGDVALDFGDYGLPQIGARCGMEFKAIKVPHEFLLCLHRYPMMMVIAPAATSAAAQTRSRLSQARR